MPSDLALFRVNDGARTRDILDHNQVLYQLSYIHRDDLMRPRSASVAGIGDSL